MMVIMMMMTMIMIMVVLCASMEVKGAQELTVSFSSLGSMAAPTLCQNCK